MENEIQKPKVGVGVMIFKDGKILLGKRRWRHGDAGTPARGGRGQLPAASRADTAGCVRMTLIRLLLCKTYGWHRYRYSIMQLSGADMACGTFEVFCKYCGEIAPGWKPRP